MKTWSETIKPVLKKFKDETDKIFLAYNKEIKAKNITSIAAQNKIWNEKYKDRLEKVEEAHDKEYKKIWTKFHKK